LAVQGGSGVALSLEDLLAVFAKSNGKQPRLVHRLDRETSGVIIAARTKPAAAFFSEAFAGRDVSKTYLAIVCGGAPAPEAGEINLALKKSSRRGLDIMEIAGRRAGGADAVPDALGDDPRRRWLNSALKQAACISCGRIWRRSATRSLAMASMAVSIALAGRRFLACCCMPQGSMCRIRTAGAERSLRPRRPDFSVQSLGLSLGLEAPTLLRYLLGWVARDSRGLSL
jgi:hypothetical protein